MTDLLTCPYCADASAIYDGLCDQCNLRRVARYTSPLAARAVAAVRAKDGDAAAGQFKREVRAEHERLVKEGQL